MPVYVDNMAAPFGRLIMAHMIADSTEELLAMADAIGVQRKWIQSAGTYREHFDIAKSKRVAAVRLGAVEITEQQCAAMRDNRRHTGQLGEPETAIAEWKSRRPELFSTQGGE